MIGRNNLKLLFTIAVLSFLLDFARSQTNATTTITNGGSSASVQVNTNINSSSSSSSTSSNKTHIRIESNGEVKEYDSDKAEDITVQSSDGKSTVRINNSVNTTTNPTPSKTMSPTPTKIDVEKKIKEEKESAEKKIAEEKQKMKNQQFNFMKWLEDLFTFKWWNSKK